jgi:DNA repair protein RadC
VKPATKLRAMLREDPEIADRMLRILAADGRPDVVRTAEDSLPHFRPLLAGREQEALAVLAMDRRHRPVACEILTIGCDCLTVVDSRQIYRWALTRPRHVCAIIIAHNHPSGDPTPSAQDRDVTARVVAAGRTLGMPCLDSLVLADPEHWASVLHG